MQHRHDADGEIARDATADLEKPDRALAVLQLLRGLRIPLRQPRHVFDSGAHRVHVLDFTRHAAARIHIAQRRILPARDDNRQVLLTRGQHPRILRIDLVALLQFSAAQNLVHELMREIPLTRLVRFRPLVRDHRLDTAHRFHLRDTRVRHAIHVPLHQLHFILRSQVTVVRHALIIIMGDEIENILLQIRTRAHDRVDLVRPNHLGERDPELRRGHRACERDQHFAPGCEVRLVTLRGIDQRRGIKMPVVMGNKF